MHQTSTKSDRARHSLAQGVHRGTVASRRQFMRKHRSAKIAQSSYFQGSALALSFSMLVTASACDSEAPVTEESAQSIVNGSPIDDVSMGVPRLTIGNVTRAGVLLKNNW